MTGTEGPVERGWVVLIEDAPPSEQTRIRVRATTEDEAIGRAVRDQCAGFVRVIGWWPERMGES